MSLSSQCSDARAVTVVVTSCDRHDLLARTLKSFFEFNTHPIREVIVVEDGARGMDVSLRRMLQGEPVHWLNTGRRIGQIGAIDKAYGLVRTPYIFHLEDDWEFYAPGFIENSLPILEENPRCLQVWVRAHDDTNEHPIDSTLFLTRGVPWRKLAFDYNPPYCGRLVWHGFAFNPGLRRLQDYRAIGTYGRHVDFEFSQPGSAEAALSCWYQERGFYAAILADRSGTGYVRHIGQDRHVGPPPEL